MARKRTWIGALAVTLALGAGVAGWRFVRLHPPVEVVRPERREVVELVIASGRLKAVRQSALGAEVAGVVDRVLVREGDRVEPGQPVVTLRRDDATQRVRQAELGVETARRELARLRAGPQREEVRRAEAELERAEAALVLAEQDYERSRSLFDRELIARREMDQARSAVDQARAARRVAREALEALRNQPRAEDLAVVEARLSEARAALRTAEVELAKRTVQAPFGALIVSRAVEPGQSVSSGTALLRVADMETTELLVETDEANLPKLRVGQPALVIAPAYAAQPFRATLRQIGPEVDSARGVVVLRLDPVALPPYGRPDMTVDVNVEVARVPDALTVPTTSLLERDGRTFVLVVRDGRARLVEVRVRGKNPDRAAVEGLPAESLVVRRAAEATPGQLVRTRGG